MPKTWQLSWPNTTKNNLNCLRDRTSDSKAVIYGATISPYHITTAT